MEIICKEEVILLSHYIPVTCAYQHPYLYWSTFLQQMQPEVYNFHNFLQPPSKILSKEQTNSLNILDTSDQYVLIGKHELPPLPYSYDALEPYIDAKTMILHHKSHHKSYVDGLNQAELALQDARNTNDYSYIKHWLNEISFNGAGHYLHTIFWSNMAPDAGGKPHGNIAEEINLTFGSFDAFKKYFSAVAEEVEGSGWAVFVWSPRSGRTDVLQLEKHQYLSMQDMVPLLVLDVWEHAYYLKYHTNRNGYIEAWWNVINWEDVEKRFLEASKLTK